jgi:hypothetical protein
MQTFLDAMPMTKEKMIDMRILAEKRSDKGFLPLPRQRPLRWFDEPLVFDAPLRSLPP